MGLQMFYHISKICILFLALPFNLVCDLGKIIFLFCALAYLFSLEAVAAL